MLQLQDAWQGYLNDWATLMYTVLTVFKYVSNDSIVTLCQMQQIALRRLRNVNLTRSSNSSTTAGVQPLLQRRQVHSAQHTPCIQHSKTSARHLSYLSKLSGDTKPNGSSNSRMPLISSSRTRCKWKSTVASFRVIWRGICFGRKSPEEAKYDATTRKRAFSMSDAARCIKWLLERDLDRKRWVDLLMERQRTTQPGSSNNMKSKAFRLSTVQSAYCRLRNRSY